MHKDQLEQIKSTISVYLETKGIEIDDVKLFGSSKEKSIDDANDIDIIILSENFKNKTIFERSKMTRGLHKRLVEQFNKPFDIIYITKSELEEKELMFSL